MRNIKAEDVTLDSAEINEAIENLESLISNMKDKFFVGELKNMIRILNKISEKGSSLSVEGYNTYQEVAQRMIGLLKYYEDDFNKARESLYLKEK